MILFCFSNFTILAETDTQNILWNEYKEFRDAVYNNSYDLEGIERLYNKAVETANINFTGNDLNIALSRCDYMLGRFFAYSNQSDLASQCFDTGLSFAELALKNNQNNYLATLMYAENLCQNCGVKPFNYVIKNGPKIGTWAKKTLELNPNCGTAMYLLNAQNIFAPSPFNNYKKGITVMRDILENPTVVLYKDDLFNILSAIGYGYYNLGNVQESLQWFNKALEIYPGNYFVNSAINKINLH